MPSTPTLALEAMEGQTVYLMDGTAVNKEELPKAECENEEWT